MERPGVPGATVAEVFIRSREKSATTVKSRPRAGLTRVPAASPELSDRVSSYGMTAMVTQGSSLFDSRSYCEPATCGLGVGFRRAVCGPAGRRPPSKKGSQAGRRRQVGAFLLCAAASRGARHEEGARTTTRSPRSRARGPAAIVVAFLLMTRMSQERRLGTPPADATAADPTAPATAESATVDGRRARGPRSRPAPPPFHP